MQDIIKAIIFDLDGVIINSNPAIETFWKSWADKEGVSLTDPMIREWIYGRKVGDTIKGLFNHVPDARKKEIEQSAYEFDSHMQPGAIDGVVEFISLLNTRQIPLGVVTSSHHPRMLTILRNLGIQDTFTHFITAHDVTRGKPHPDPYLKMSEKMNLPSHACLVFEDAVSGIQSAAAAGMHSIGIGNDYSKKDLLSHGATDVVIDFTHIHITREYLSVKNRSLFRIS